MVKRSTRRTLEDLRLVLLVAMVLGVVYAISVLF